ncbi:MAG: hypothetical protein ACR2MB_05545 [Acidimicrobiales bacterium]
MQDATTTPDSTPTPGPSPTGDTTSRAVLDLSAFTWVRRQEAIDLAVEVRAAMTTVSRLLYEANDLLAQLNVEEGRVTSRAHAAKVTTLQAGDDELWQTVVSLSGSTTIHAALADLANMADPDSTDNSARRKALHDEVEDRTAVEHLAAAMRDKRVRRMSHTGPTDLGGGYTAEQDGGDLVVRHDGIPVARDSLSTLATVAAQLEACRSGEVTRLR